MHFKGVSIIPVCICDVLLLAFSGKVRCKNAFCKSKIFSQGFKNNKEKCVTCISISATHIQPLRGLGSFVLANRAPSHFAELGTWWESNSASFFQKSGKKNCIHVGTDFSALNVPNLLITFFSLQNSVWWLTEQWMEFLLFIIEKVFKEFELYCIIFCCT